MVDRLLEADAGLTVVALDVVDVGEAVEHPYVLEELTAQPGLLEAVRGPLADTAEVAGRADPGDFDAYGVDRLVIGTAIEFLREQTDLGHDGVVVVDPSAACRHACDNQKQLQPPFGTDVGVGKRGFDEGGGLQPGVVMHRQP